MQPPAPAPLSAQGMIGIVPAAGSAERLQPLGGSKELLPLGWSDSPNGSGRRLKAVAEHLLERMTEAGATRVCLVVSGGKADLLRYFAHPPWAGRVFFVVQPRPLGLCDAVFRAAPFVAAAEPVLIGLPDTVWYPRDAYAAALRDRPHLITFPVPNPEEFDAVIPAAPGADAVGWIEVKRPGSPGRRVWGAITAPGADFLRLHQLWLERGRRDAYLGDLLNAWLASGGALSYDRAGTHYWDIGTPAGYERALNERVWEPVSRAAPLRQAG